MTAQVDGRTAAQRFWPNVDISDDCWLWTGYVKPNGYANFYPGGGRHVPKVYVHRFAYEAVRGPIPDGLQLDHLCNVRHCVKPTHLEAVTQRENLSRGVARRTHCKRGHEYDEANTYWHRGNRKCRTCGGYSQLRIDPERLSIVRGV